MSDLRESLNLKKTDCCFQSKKRGSLEGKKMHLVASSGKPFQHHYWGNLGLDLDRFTVKDSAPVLWSHDRDKVLGVFSRGDVLVNGELAVDATLIDSDAAQHFVKLAKSGVPLECSLFGIPSKIERIEEGETTEVNGHTLTGPGTVWRAWQLREVSPSIFGYDQHTKADLVFSGSNESLALDVEICDADEIWVQKMLCLAVGADEDPNGQQGLLSDDSEDALWVKMMIEKSGQQLPATGKGA